MKSKGRHILAVSIILSVLLVMQSCGGKKVQAVNDPSGLKGHISLSGAFALYPLAVRWGAEFQRMHPGVTVDISAGGAGKGITDALAGQVDLGMVSRELKPAEAEKGALPFAVGMDAVVPTVNVRNPAYKYLRRHGLSLQTARRLWLGGESLSWGSVVGRKDIAYPVHLYTRSDACGAAETWASWLGGTQEDLQGVGVYGDPAVAQQIQKDALGIGMNNIGYVYDNKTNRFLPGIAIAPIDVNGNGRIDADEDFYDSRLKLIEAIRVGKYPMPPARNLYLVSNGKPKSKVLRAFLEYVLSEGQKINLSAGYLPLDNKRLADEKSKM